MTGLREIGVLDYLYRDSEIDFLFSGSEKDPMINADLDGYDFANGRPWVSFVLVGEFGVRCFVVIFDNYRAKVSFLKHGYESKFIDL